MTEGGFIMRLAITDILNILDHHLKPTTYCKRRWTFWGSNRGANGYPFLRFSGGFDMKLTGFGPKIGFD